MRGKNVLNTCQPDEYLTLIWQQTDEYKHLWFCYGQGIISEWDDFSALDNPYKPLTPEYCFWLQGYTYELNKHLALSGK